MATQPRPLPPGVEAFRDLEYARAKVAGSDTEKPLLLDVYVPKSTDGPIPLIVWIHGGGWRAGDKMQCPAIGFLRDGYVVASINYRLSGEATFPAQIHDCKAAIRWLRANAAKYKIDPDRIGVWGSSAGGHLAALLGTSGGAAELEGDLGPKWVSSRVQAVCDCCGPSDLGAMFRDRERQPGARHDNAVELLLGGAVAETLEAARQASPVTYASQDDPPFLIVHGDRDPVVPIAQGRALYDVLKKAGCDVQMLTIPNGGHGTGGPQADPVIREFFARTLRGGSTSKPTRPAP